MKLTDFSRFRAAIESLGMPILVAAISRELRTGEMGIAPEDVVCGGAGLYGLIERNGKLFVTKIILHIADYQVQFLSRGNKVDAEAAFRHGEYDAFELRAHLHKYHFSYCDTLQYMFAANRRHRYKQSHRQDGKFNYAFTDGDVKVVDRKNQILNVCRNCLRWLHTEHGIRATVESFRPSLFFDAVHEFEWLPDCGYKSDLAPGDIGYPADFAEISEKVKKKRQYHCEQCGVNLENYRRFLDCHHINADTADNRFANLQCLCVKCHAEQQMHGHIKQSPRYKKFFPIWETWHRTKKGAA